MPLPNAKPDPEDSNVYKQLSSIKASDLTRSQLDVIRDPLFLNDESEDVLRRIALIGLVTDQLSFSGAIPRTAQQAVSSVTFSGSATVIQELFKPSVGEVWVYNHASVRMQGGSSGITLFLGNDPSTSTNNVMLGQETSTGVQPFDLVGQQSPIYITSDQYLIASHYSLASGESSEVRVSVIRVR
tara:strand:- start:563 stop:1117 length:555 start_codon:yes stop_codon:yes gene_type:complete